MQHQHSPPSPLTSGGGGVGGLEPITEETQSDLHSTVSGSVSGHRSGGASGGSSRSSSARSTPETVRRAGGSAADGRGGTAATATATATMTTRGSALRSTDAMDITDDAADEIRNPSLKRWWHVMGMSASSASSHRRRRRRDGHHSRSRATASGTRRGPAAGRRGSDEGSSGRGSSTNSERGSSTVNSESGNSSTLAVDMGDDGRESGAHGTTTANLNLLPPIQLGDNAETGLGLLLHPISSMEGEYDANDNGYMYDNEDVEEDAADMTSTRIRSFGSDGSGGVELGLAAAGAAGAVGAVADLGEEGPRGPDYAAGGTGSSYRKVSFSDTVQVASLPPATGASVGGGVDGTCIGGAGETREEDGGAAGSSPSKKRKKKKHHHHHHTTTTGTSSGTAPASSGTSRAGSAGMAHDHRHGHENKLVDRCVRSKILIFSALLASILAIAIGVAVHFAGGQSGSVSSSSSAGGSEAGVSQDEIITEAPTTEFVYDDGSDVDVDVDGTASAADDNGRGDPDKGSTGGGGGNGIRPTSPSPASTTPRPPPVMAGPTSAPTADPYREDYLAAAEELLWSISAPLPPSLSTTTIDDGDGDGEGDSDPLPSGPNPIEVDGTPQNLAYRWITTWDRAELQLDVGQPFRQGGGGGGGGGSSGREVVTERRYSQRYALGVMYYSLGGTRVENDDGDGRSRLMMRRRMSDDHAGAKQDGSTLLDSNPSRPVNADPKVKHVLPKRRNDEPSRRHGLRILQDVNADAENIEPTSEPTTEPTVEVLTPGPTPDEVSLEPTTPSSPLGAPAMDPFDNYVTSSSSSPDDEPFLSSRHECRWHGVSCESRLIIDSSTGKVTGASEEVVVAIDLSGMGLTGTIPHEIGSGIITLEDLSLYDNDIVGPIPPSMTTLKDLYFVDIGKNWLTGSVPVFGESLTYLYLNGNRLTGNSNRGKNGINYDLKHLWLHQNSLSGTLSDRISNFGNLEQLILYENNFSGSIPTTISSLTKLSYLDLSDNAFTGTLPDSLYEITTLVNLYLSKNQFSGPIVAPIRRLVNLEFLWVDSNQFSGSVRPAIGDLLNLKSILLQDNQFGGEMPDPICGLFADAAASDGAQGQLTRLEADCGGDLPKVNCTCCTQCW